MRLISDTQERVRILALGGEIDLNFTPVLRALLKRQTDVPSEALILDLSEVTFVDSSGIAAIIEHLRTATRQSSWFCIGGVSEAVKEIFEVICLGKAMPVFETKEAALAALDQKKLRNPQKPLFAAE